MNPKSTPEAEFEYVRAEPCDWRAAAQVWFGPEVTSQQVETFLQTTKHDPTLAHGWWVARRGKEVAAVQLVLPQAGAMAVCWPPVCRAGDQAHCVPLWQAARTALHEHGSRLIQCLVPVQDSLAEALMTALGFERITELITMQCTREAIEAACARAETAVELQPVTDNLQSEFELALGASYTESRDVPEMEQYQKWEDVLAGYATPPSRCWVLRDGEKGIAGVLVLTQDDRVGQLNYLGIVPAARRRGLARAIVAWALVYFRHHDARQVLVRLDARNEPARQLYTGCGFVESHRDVLLVSR
jgi:GNAT superfamily N-acetyltransferase